MQQDDALFLYTDGVTEARSINGEFFGEERMFDVLGKEPITSSVSLLDRMDAALLGHVGAADQFDDITMMALLRTGA
jgi:serine phosphatase RsbU (regulator of sigma subunit)